MPPVDEPIQDNEPSQETKTAKRYKVKLLKKHLEISIAQLLVFGLLFGLVGGYAIYKSLAASPESNQSATINTGRLLLRFKPNATKAQRDNALRSNNVRVVKEIPQIGVKLIEVPANAAEAVKTALSHNPAVDFVEQDQVLKAQEQLPNDPYFPQQSALGGGAWGWYQTHTTQAWDITQGDPAVSIAILDTGIKPAGLMDFDGQIGSTWNIMNNSTDATSSAGNHGTYVAGAAGLAINNGVGNAGFCPKCKLMIVQVGTDSGANLSDIASGLIYAADHGAKVANMSWAGPSNSSTLSSATTYAHGKGVVMTAAAGNSNCDCVTYPSASPYVIAVGGTNNIGSKASDSNFGSWVTMAAPEGNLTGWPTINGAPGYAPVGGTSLASPVVAGITGLLFSYNTGLTSTQVEQAMENTAVTVPFSVKYGRVDSLAALQSLGAADPQPASLPVQTASGQLYYSLNGTTSIAPLTAAPQPGQVLVRGIGGWTGSAGLAVSGLQWQRCDGGGNNCSAITSANTYTVLSTDAGSTLKLIYSVKNSLGSTPLVLLSGVVGGSANADTTPPTVSVTAPSSGSTVFGAVTISANASDNAAVSKVVFSVDGSSLATVTSAPYTTIWNSTTVVNGSHTITVTAYDSSNNVSSSSVIVTTSNGDTTAPAVPSGLAPTPLNSAVTLTWNTNTEPDLANYDLQYKPTSGSSWTTVSAITSITYTINSLVNGTSYDFQLRAKDTSGNLSAWTATVSATPIANTPADTIVPTVTINNPANGASITSARKLNISASATDNNVVIKMELYIDDALRTTVTTPTLSYSWTINKNVKAGAHTITVKAYDAAGNVGTSSVSVTK